MIHIASYPDQKLNPYCRLYYASLREYGVEVFYFNHVTDSMLSRREQPIDVLHFHWAIEIIWRIRGERSVAQMRAVAGWWTFLRKARQRGIRIVWTVHELAPPEAANWIDWAGYRILAASTDLFICHSRQCRDDVIARFRVDPAKVLVIPIGVYDDVFPQPQPGAQTREQYGLDQRRRLLICFGDLRPRKGVETAIDAVEHLGNDVQLVIAGKATNQRSLAWLDSVRRRVAQAANVRLIDRELSDQQLADLIHAADCVLLPYLKIVGSSALTASLALGRAVVASDLPFFREMLAPEPQAGVLFQPGVAKALAAGIDAFFSVPLEARHAAARRLGDQLKWTDVTLPVGNWLLKNVADTCACPKGQP